MPCFRPWEAARLDDGTIVRAGTPGWRSGAPLQLPCGICFGCRIQRTRHWAIRCTHEAATWRENLFITLTYDDEHLDWRQTLNKKHLQRFLKRLRRRQKGAQELSGNRPIRFFAAGEYGDQTERPHYHALLFNLRLPDQRRYGATSTTSAFLSELWRYGSHLIEQVTPASIAYVAGYATKKIHGRHSKAAAYGITDPETGEWIQRQEPFNTMSRRPGVGHYWYQKYKKDLQRGHLIHQGKPSSIPKYYEQKYITEHPEEKDIRQLLKQNYIQTLDPNEKSERRLAEKEYVAMHHHQILKKPETL